MGSQGVMSHQLIRNLLRQRRIKSALFVDRRQFRNLACGICREFFFFEAEVGLFGIRLRTDGHVFTSRHGHRPGDQPGDPCDQNVVARRLGRRDAEDQARGRDDAVVSAQNRRAVTSRRVLFGAALERA